jgi:gas vesicle protein
VFKDIVSRNLDWPEAIWEAWLSFEHAHGSLDELEFCMDQVKRTQAEVNFRRAKVLMQGDCCSSTELIEPFKEAQKIAYQASASIAHQAQPELGTAAADDISTAHVNQIISEAVSTNNDEFYASSSRVKRKAEEEPAERVKKAKIGMWSLGVECDAC